MNRRMFLGGLVASTLALDARPSPRDIAAARNLRTAAAWGAAAGSDFVSGLVSGIRTAATGHQTFEVGEDKR